MSKDDDFKDRMSENKPRSAKDRELWELAVKDVKKLQSPEPYSRKISLRPHRIHGPKMEIPLSGSAALNPQSGPLDRRTESLVRKGLVRIEGSLDLHGVTANAARGNLLQFVLQAVGSGKRCILIVTGKGETAPGSQPWYEDRKGVIRREFRQWLEDPAVKPWIMSVAQAQPRHGGSGAFYIYLRKKS